jgi:O-antigen/teichoic acid export membrane protein
MPPPDAPAFGVPGGESSPDVARAPIRGSSLLVGGRVLALGIMCAVQVLMVRHLSRTDYGAWTYALSVMALLQALAALGVDRSVARFVSIYREQGDLHRLRGVVVLLLLVLVASGLCLGLAFNAFPDALARATPIEAEVLPLLGVAIFLVPLEALELLVVALLACLGRARALVVRRSLVTPGLKLFVVAAMVALVADIWFLAYGYLAASVTGLLLYLPLVWRAFGELGLLRRPAGERSMILPVREVFSFTLPLLGADLAGALMASAGALVLGYYSTLDQVAVFTAAVPLAVLNQTVMRNFAVLYTPALSRLYARGDRAGIDALYWRTAAWVAVLTCPIFIVTFGASGALLHVLYGVRYSDAAAVLSLLALGEYVNVALGLNGLTLRLLDRVRYSVAVNAVSAATAVLANLALVPSYGAFGAAVATAGTMIVHGLLKQVGLGVTGVRLFERRFAPVYLAIAGFAIALAASRWIVPAQSFVLLPVAIALSVLLVVASRRTLMVAETFPELRRVPLLRALLA